jgi:UDPglucose 6-dehydrogenase
MVQYDARLLKSVEEVNGAQKEVLPRRVVKHFGERLKGATIGLWGLSFKPNTDDMRAASSRVLMERLWDHGAIIQAYDPEAMDECQRIYGSRADLRLVGTKEAAIAGASALVICTEWKAFRAPDFDQMRSLLSEPVIFDGRNLYEPSKVQKAGFKYFAIGRGDSVTSAPPPAR